MSDRQVGAQLDSGVASRARTLAAHLDERKARPLDTWYPSMVATPMAVKDIKRTLIPEVSSLHASDVTLPNGKVPDTYFFSTTNRRVCP